LVRLLNFAIVCKFACRLVSQLIFFLGFCPVFLSDLNLYSGVIEFLGMILSKGGLMTRKKCIVCRKMAENGNGFCLCQHHLGYYMHKFKVKRKADLFTIPEFIKLMEEYEKANHENS